MSRAEAQQKLAQKYDHVLEGNVKRWIEQETGERFQSDFASSLKDGVLLCKLVNALSPGMVPTINTSKMPFKQMENIEHFLAACKSLGLQDGQLFVAIDLYEKANMTQVLQALYSLSKAVHKDIGGDGAASGGGVGFDFSMFQKKSD